MLSRSLAVMAALSLVHSVQIDISKSTTDATTVKPTVESTTVAVEITTIPSKTIETTTGPAPAGNVTIPILTTQPPTVLNETTHSEWPVVRREVAKRSHALDNYFCRCDLIINLCDINCCCDIDCTAEQIHTFKCDERDQNIHDFDWDNGLHECSLKNDLFCVWRHNDNHEVRYNPHLGKQFKHNWPNAFADAPTSEDDREHYRYNDPISIFHETTESVHPLTMPTSIVGNVCHLNAPITFLRTPQSFTCQRSAQAHELFVNNLQNRLTSSKLLTSRRGLGNHAMMSEFCGTDDSDNSLNCRSILVFNCISSITAGQCNRITDVDSDISPTLENHQIVFDFAHNFTNLLNASVYFVFDAPTGRDQRTTEIRFRQLNESLIPHHGVSGNIGYEQGNPLIISYWTPSNASAENSPPIVNYFHVNNSHHNEHESHLKLPSFQRNICRLNNNTYATVNFGQDIYVACDVLLDSGNLTENPATNITELCHGFQSTISHYILNGVRQRENQTDFSDVKTIVSMLGSPVNASESWTHIASSANAEAAAVEGHRSDGDEADNSFRCRNIVLGVSYEFHFARLRVRGQPHQNVVKDVKLKLGTKVDLKFRWGEEWRVPVFVDGMFLDLTGYSG